MREITDTLMDIHEKLADIRGSQIRQEEQHKVFDTRLGKVEEELEPVQAHVEQMRGAGKLIAIVATLVTIAALIITLV